MDFYKILMTSTRDLTIRGFSNTFPFSQNTVRAPDTNTDLVETHHRQANVHQVTQTQSD